MGCILGKRAAGDGPKKQEPVTNLENIKEEEEEEPGPVVEKQREKKKTLTQKPKVNLLSSSHHSFIKTQQQGWPPWLSAVAGEAIQGWIPRRADTFEKLSKIGQGTYSNVYKARDLISGKIVALKKVRFDNLEPESVKFMAREILVLRRLDHPNVVKLEGLVTSRMSSSLYLVFEYMEHDLAGLVASSGIKFTEAQRDDLHVVESETVVLSLSQDAIAFNLQVALVKCYMKQLLSGLEHCHSRGVLHRDIKGSNLLIDNEGVLKIADFGLASFYDPDQRHPMTSRVVTLWYRPPELLLGATFYDVGVDLWSAGCILGELLAGKPLMPGRTEFFTTKPYACEPSNLPRYPPSKEMDVKLRDEEAKRQRGLGGKVNVGDGAKRVRPRDRTDHAVPAPEANAELQVNLDRWRLLTQGNAKSKSEKFPPPHQDGAVAFPLDTSQNGPASFAAPDISFTSSIFEPKSSNVSHSSSLRNPKAVEGAARRKTNKAESRMTSSQTFIRAFKPSSFGRSMDRRIRGKQSVSEIFGG
ncbi:hypothetical protein IFM89_033928 [Coptis chinensis]|uniref:Protein kinase domain-containing protein n=1 Tax=Coptis chinensis TaxID=261450 RepID=A0A835HUR5_9MAGN|nr:hypothetical protein IFM89_033928 [Coptis chinensis]